jgi:UDP-glucose 4-epimerase
MTVLVTGGAGYIGSHMVHALVDAGEKVVVLDNLATGFDWAVAERAPLVVGDTGDQPLVASIIAEHGVEAIIHFAASTVVPESVAQPLAYYRNNTVNSRALIETAVKGGVKHFIFSSTAAVYGNPERVPVAEDAPTMPMSPYGSSKLMTEIMLRDAGFAHGLGYVILRYFNVAGADPQLRTGQSTRNATHIIKVATEAAVGLRPKVDVFGNDYPTADGTGIRDYIHVSDLADAHVAAIERLAAGHPSDVFNLGNGHGFSVADVVATAERVTGRTVQRNICPRRAGDPAVLISDSSKARVLLSWTPRFPSLDEQIAHAWAWLRDDTNRARPSEPARSAP